MQLDAIKWIEGKAISFDEMLKIIKAIRQMQKDGLILLEDQELNEKFLEKVIDRAQEFQS